MPRVDRIRAQSLFSEEQLRALTQPGPLPLYYKLHHMLRRVIQSGRVPLGGRLPTEQDIGEAAGISRVTVKRAMDELAAEGFIQRRRGVGSIVSYSPPLSEPVRAPLIGMLESLEQMGRSTRVRVIEIDRRPPPESICNLYQTRSPLLYTLRVRSQQECVFGYYESWTNIDNVPADKALFEQKARLEIFRDAGVVLSEIHQAIKGVAASGAAASYLGVPEGRPLTSIERFSYNQKAELVDYLEVFYNPEFFEYRMELKTS